MNTNGGPNSMGTSGSRATYAGTDSSSQIMQVVASNSLIPLGLYQNMEKDHLDWGALAQQWIQMREQWSQPTEELIPSPPPPPSFSPANEQYPPRNTFDSLESLHPYSTLQQTLTLSKYEEQGEAPMEVEKEEEVPASSSLMHPVTAPQQPIVNPNATAAVASWQAKINQLYQMESTQVRPNMGAIAKSQRGFPRASHSIETEAKPLPSVHGLMERELKLAMSGSGDRGTLSLNDGVKDSYSGGSITMNEAKRKLLPAWIREGLEKMERDKQRQFEREQERKQWEEQQRRQRCMEEATDEAWSPVKLGTSVNNAELLETPASTNLLRSSLPMLTQPARDHVARPEDEVGLPAASPSQTPMSELTEGGTENVDDDFEKVAIAVRTTLTEILLDVTGSMINSIAKETIGKINKRKGKLAQSTQVKTSMATCTGALGLGIYGDSDEDDEEEEEEQQQKKQIFGKGDGSGSDSERDDSTDGDLSDAAVEQKLKETIRRKQREFESSAREIEQWVDSLQQDVRETDEPKSTSGRQQLFRKPEHDVYHSPDEALDDEGEDGSGLSDGGDETNTKQSGSSGPVGSSTTKLNGVAGPSGSARYGSTRDGETQPVNDKLYASQHFVGRKRREKRVSRFSVLQEPRGRLSAALNTPIVPPVMTYKLGTMLASDQSAITRARPGDASKQLPTDTTSTKADQTLVDQPLSLISGMLRSRGTDLTIGNQLSATEQILKRYLQAIQPPSAETSEGRQSQDPKGAPDDELNAGASSSASTLPTYKTEPEPSLGDLRKSHHHRERSEKSTWVADAGQHRAQHRGRDPHRHRSRSKSSRSYTRSPHSVSGSTRSRSSRSRSRSVNRDCAGQSSMHHRHRSERSRHHGSRRRSRSRSHSRNNSRSRSRSRSRSSERYRRSSSSKYSSRRRY